MDMCMKSGESGQCQDIRQCLMSALTSGDSGQFIETPCLLKLLKEHPDFSKNHEYKCWGNPNWSHGHSATCNILVDSVFEVLTVHQLYSNSVYTQIAYGIK
jgi:hypothetical protein